MAFGVSAGSIARTYTEQCVGILTELLRLQQEHITSGNHLHVVCLADAFRNGVAGSVIPNSRLSKAFGF